MKIYALVLTAMFLLAGCADNSPVISEYPKSGIASWYSASRTATGEKFNNQELTCAMRRRDFGKFYKVCNTSNERCVVVRHNNFGPAKRLFNRGRIIDLSKKAFSEIADLNDGVIKVSVEELQKEQINDD